MNATPEQTMKKETPSSGSEKRLFRRQDFDREVVKTAIAEALAALEKAKMKMPLNLARELQLAHDHLLNAGDWVKIYTPNIAFTEQNRP